MCGRFTLGALAITPAAHCDLSEFRAAGLVVFACSLVRLGKKRGLHASVQPPSEMSCAATRARRGKRSGA